MNKVRTSGAGKAYTGYFLRSMMQEKEVSLDTLAKRIEMKPADALRLVEGGIRITSDMAEKLGATFHTGSAFWHNVCELYQ